MHELVLYVYMHKQISSATVVTNQVILINLLIFVAYINYTPI
jgi:hypothetical protein